jgi:hypothetical protein
VYEDVSDCLCGPHFISPIVLVISCKKKKEAKVVVKAMTYGEKACHQKPGK